MTATATTTTTTAGGALPRTLVVGLGKTGMSCVKLLMNEGVPLAVVDSRENPPGLAYVREYYPDMAMFLGGFDPTAFAAAERIVLSPGVSMNEPLVAEARRRGVPVVGDIELFAQRAKAPVVAITGSNGKSTVTHMMTDMIKAAGLRVAMGGNVGTPALALLEEPVPDFYVLELSSFQLETTYSLKPVTAVILNVTEDHMDRYIGMSDYLAAKMNIFRGKGVVVINRDDPLLVRQTFPGRRVVTFGLDDPKHGQFGVRIEKEKVWLAAGDNALMPADELLVAGSHNVANALAALAMGDALGLSMGAMLNALRNFRGLPHRVEFVGEKNGVRWFNDSKGTNVGASVAAIRGMGGKVVLIAGGIGKGADFSPLGPVMTEFGRAAVLLGRDAPAIAEVLRDKVSLEFVKSMHDAVLAAQRLAQPGDVVLLSPACASFDMFANYEERGAVFTQEVRSLLK